MFKWLKRLIFIGIVGFVVYAGFMFGVPYYKYLAFKMDAQDIIRFQVKGEKDMRERFIKTAREIGVPVKDKDIKITQKGERYSVKISWSETVNLRDLYKKKLDFSFEAGG